MEVFNELCPLCDDEFVFEGDRVCEDCIENMSKGILIIGIDHELTRNILDPFRSSGRFIVSERFLKSLFEGVPDMLDTILDRRVTFIPEALIKALDMYNSQSEDVIDVSNKNLERYRETADVINPYMDYDEWDLWMAD